VLQSKRTLVHGTAGAPIQKDACRWRTYPTRDQNPFTKPRMQCTLGRVEYVTPHRVCSIRRDREAQWRGLRIPRGYWGKRIVVARWSQFLRPDRREGWISRVTTHEFPCAPRTLTSQSSGRTVDSPSLGLASDETEGESVIHRVKTSNAGTLTPDPHDRAAAHGKKNPCAAVPVRLPSRARAGSL
jgi:hypothetical protein